MSRISNVFVFGAFIITSIFTFASDTDCIPFVTFKQLMQSPGDYNRKVIVVEGWTRRGLEFFALQAVKEPLQKELIWIDNIDFVRATEKLLPAKIKYRATKEPILDRAAEIKYQKLFAHKKPAHVVLKGEFQTLEEEVPGYGSFQYNLIVYEVISIE
jgi:hypothetical protein